MYWNATKEEIEELAKEHKSLILRVTRTDGWQCMMFVDSEPGAIGSVDEKTFYTIKTRQIASNNPLGFGMLRSIFASRDYKVVC